MINDLFIIDRTVFLISPTAAVTLEKAADAEHDGKQEQHAYNRAHHGNDHVSAAIVRLGRWCGGGCRRRRRS
jgi:hypothetical protein